jgi:hypothetical protein
MRFIAHVCAATTFVLLQMSYICGQTGPKLVPVSEITDKSLNSVVNDAIVISFHLSPDGKQLAILAIAGPKLGPLWLTIVDTKTTRVAASKELGPSTWPTSDFLHQVRYSSDQKYLVVQDLQHIRVLDAGSLETLRTISGPATMDRQMPLFIVGAGQSDIFACAFGSEQQPKYGFRPTPVQVQVVDVSSGKILGAWASEDVPQSVSPNGALIAVSSWQTPNRRGVVPLAVFDTNGRKVADLDDGFSFSKSADGSKPLGRVLGGFVSNQEILLVPDEHTDEAGRHSGETIKLVSVATQQIEQSVKPEHFAPTGKPAISNDGKTILVISFYIPPRLLAQPHGARNGGEGKLLILTRDPKLQVDSSVPIDSLTQEPRVSSDGSVIAIRHYNRDVTVLMRSSHDK